jgi:hypothetical protein
LNSPICLERRFAARVSSSCAWRLLLFIHRYRLLQQGSVDFLF